ncbi:ATP-binding cassette domain-containing protein [Solwaraspora sp. WMMB335]|uniref:ATP-binding cassette domain-containing protein n=1 Tax=Solwaraspora sp. WMMB335 TaxID=3404118 RepID=UPI003B940B55
MTRSRVAPVTLRALSRQPGSLGRLAAWSALEALPALVTGYATARAVDDGFLAGQPALGMAWLAATAATVLVGAAGTAGTYRCLATIVEPFRDQLTDLVVTASLRRAVGTGTAGDPAAVSRLTHQVETVRDTFAGLIMVVRGFLVAATAALIGLMSLDPLVAALVAAPLVVGLILFAATLPAMAARQRTYVHAGERLGGRATDTIRGHRDVTACGAQTWAATQVGAAIDAQAAAERTLAAMAATRSLVLAVGAWLPLILLLSAAPWLVDRGLTPGAVLGALVYVCTGLQPALHALVQGVAAGGLRFVVTLDRLLRESCAPVVDGSAGDRDSGVQRHRTPVPARRAGTGVPAAAVDLREVTYHYQRSTRPVIDRLTLCLPAGAHLAVVGPSGAGKSTFAALVAGLRRADHGTVELAGRPIHDLTAAELAELRVLVPQEAYVFTGTVADNLRYLRPKASDTDLLQAVDRLGLRPLVDRLGGLTEPVDPALLSGGERQVLAAARAYLSPAPLAVLDEATSHCDPATEARIEHAFMARPGALIVIAHRISSALRAPRVLVIDDRSATLGPHEEQLVSSGTYRDLVGYWSARPAGPDPVS